LALAAPARGNGAAFMEARIENRPPAAIRCSTATASRKTVRTISDLTLIYGMSALLLRLNLSNLFTRVASAKQNPSADGSQSGKGFAMTIDISMKGDIEIV
jgi:hypothetical protein